VVPLRVGGGTRIKIFEALAMARPVVSTTVGAEGLPVTDGQNILLADDPDAFASAVVRLLKDAELRQRIGRAGRCLAERYSWDAAAQRFSEICVDAVCRARTAHEHH
jgi:glycosyltransferase involved in cell wall biosynthesis